jgi:hypothetical protein
MYAVSDAIYSSTSQLIIGCIHADIIDNSETRPPSRVALISEISEISKKPPLLASKSAAQVHRLWHCGDTDDERGRVGL